MEILSPQPLAFINPEWLWAALPPTVALLYGIFRSIASVSIKTTQQKNTSGQIKYNRSGWAVKIACILIAFSLARPYMGEKNITIKTATTSRQVLVALDVSRSMLVEDVRPNRLERARMLIRSLLDSLAGEQIGLVLFAGTAFLQCPMSTDHDVLREMLPSVGPDFIPRGGTNYDKMLQTALSSFPQDPKASPVLIVISDGEALDESWRTHIPVILQRGISVITLGIGTEEGGLVPSQNGGFEKHPDGRPVLSRLEVRTLQELASATGGIYLNASQWVDLADVVSQVESRRASANVREKNITQKNEVFHWPLLVATSLVFLALLTAVPVHPARRKLHPHSTLVSSQRKSMLPSQNMLQKKQTLLQAILVLTLLPCSNSTTAQIPTNNQVPLLTPQNNTATQQKLTAEEARAKLLETVKKLSQTAHSTPASDYAEFANDTLNYLESASQYLTGANIRSLALDGLDAVRRGSIRAPRAADWDDLRKKLELWLEKDPPQQDPQDQQSQNQNNQQNNPQQNNSDTPEQNQHGSCDNNQNNNSEAQNIESQNNNHSSQQPGQNNNQDNSPDSDSSNKNNPDINQQKNQQPPKQNNNNQMTRGPLGDRPLKDTQNDDQLNKQQNNTSQPQNPAPTTQPNQRPATQRIGGQNIKQTDQPLESLPPELRDALMLLDQAKQNDRPAVLFERMMDRQKTSADEGKNW